MDPNIDYSHDEHPLDRFLQQDNTNRGAEDVASTSSSGNATQSTNNDDFYGQEAIHDTQDLVMPDLNIPLVSRLPAFGRLVKRTKQFNATTEAEFDTFCEVCGPPFSNS